MPSEQEFTCSSQKIMSLMTSVCSTIYRLSLHRESILHPYAISRPTNNDGDPGGEGNPARRRDALAPALDTFYALEYEINWRFGQERNGNRRLNASTRWVMINTVSCCYGACALQQGWNGMGKKHEAALEIHLWSWQKLFPTP